MTDLGRRANNSRPSSSQLITCSMFPYQRRNAPPLLKGNHFRFDALASDRFRNPSPIRDLLSSYHSRKNRASFAVASPCLGAAIVVSGGSASNAVKNASLTQ